VIGTDAPVRARDDRIAQARDLLATFAIDTGLVDGEKRQPPVRYLWTDAFAVCDLLGLGERQLAVRLVDQVHAVLRPGATAPDHPTVAGLRIGKRLPERAADEPFDEHLEWDRDGQYFHYLTKWMHALDQVARVTREPRYNVWARELMETAFRAFTYMSSVGRRMYWKMSVDLSRPLVPSMGHHDPLDGYVTCLQLRATAERLGIADAGPDLRSEAAEFKAMIPFNLATDDPLGIGDLLADAWLVDQLRAQGFVRDGDFRDKVLSGALSGLRSIARAGLTGPATQRLAFRELGLSIGLAAVPHLARSGGPSGTVHALLDYYPLRDGIEGFWLRPENRDVRSWFEHLDINEVMLATSLVPDGYLVLQP
jgi:hypothetical protein